MARKTKLNSVEAVIDALGGSAAAQKIAGVSQPAVSNWKARGRMPAEFFLVFGARLRKKAATVDPSLFGIQKPEARA